MPAWFGDVIGAPVPAEGARIDLGARRYVVRGGILRDEELLSASQAQTSETFGFKWRLRDTFESETTLERVRRWLVERYGEVADAPWWDDLGSEPLVLDAGCGAAMSAIELFGERLRTVRYLGIDVSEAVEVARDRFVERSLEGGFLQADLGNLPLPPGSVDVAFSEGVLHHTDSTELALRRVADLIRPGGWFLFYVYRRKGPIREFTDDYIRDRLQALSPQEGWDALVPLTKLGKALGDMDVVVDVAEPIELLGIPAGPIPLQRFIYWHVFKAFHQPDATIDELNHINYDWYAPRNAHRQTEEQVRAWCADANLRIERERVEEAGITIVAQKKGGD